MFLLLFIQILICSIPRLLIRSSLYLFFHPFIIQYDPRNSDDGNDDHDENEDDNDDDNDVDENYGENHDENQIQLMKMIIIMMVGTMVIIT